MKINSIHFGGRILLGALVVGVIVPLVIWWVWGIFLYGFCIGGGCILAGLLIIFIVEHHQDAGSVPYEQRVMSKEFRYDAEKQRPVIRASICNGEKIAGFKDKETGRFTEVVVIRSAEDIERFRKAFGILEEIPVEY